MRLALSAAVIASTISVGTAFAPSAAAVKGAWGIASQQRTSSPAVPLLSTVEAADTAAATVVDQKDLNHVSVEAPSSPSASVPAVTGAEIKSRLEKQLAKLRQKDSKSRQLSKEDIKVVFEDEHVIIVNKPAGVLSVSKEFPNLAQAVCDAYGCEMGSADKMVVHRLGMDTSGLMVFAKTLEAVRGMNTIFRTRKIERSYEALVCGHIEKDEGLIDLPLMRDYEFPPFMRVSTDNHQRALVNVDPTEVGKKILELPKDSLTKYQVVAREEMAGQPVTRVSLTSISGRTHQLNVHMAAFGHPIVGDSVYGMGGEAAPNGGLSDSELAAMIPNPSRASVEVQKQLADAAKSACVHAKSLQFRHPVTKSAVSLSADSPF